MILIISSQEDNSTNHIIDWLRYYKHPYKRISSENIIEVLEIEIPILKEKVKFKIDGEIYYLSDFCYVWYRRSYISLKSYEINHLNDSKFKKTLNNQLLSENYYLQEYIEKYLFDISLNKRSDVFLNKLKILDLASKLGLNIPKTKVISNKQKLLDFLNIEPNLITKNISPGVFVDFENGYLNSYTTEVNVEDVDCLPETFQPMLFQNKIEKAFELRVFYLDGFFYTTAIISQNDINTTIDFRNYNVINPNRTPCYKLPIELNHKLKKLMFNLDLDSGSIDIIVDKNGNYIFLEINPIGQFQQVSKPGNYYLEKKIAEYLIKKSNEKSNSK